jgi:hypothetical protein
MVGIDGVANTFIVVSAVLAQPLLSVTVYVMVEEPTAIPETRPTGLIVVFKLLLLLQTPPSVAFDKVVVLLKHTVVAPDVTDTVGNAFTFIAVTVDVAEQLFPSVTVTVLLAVAFTVIVCVVSPEFQNHELPALAVKFTELPEQNVVGPPALIVEDGNALTFTIADPLAVLVQVVELLS